MKKQILISLSVIAAVAAVAVGGTMALFSDTETSNGNIFTAGAIDLKVDHTYASYNGEECNDCVVAGENLVINGDFEDPSLPNNSWQVYPDGIPGWEASDAGIEVQHNAAGAAHGGTGQLVELDSHGTGSSSAMEQVIDTVPGQKYRLIFWHSPRPNNSPADDNAIRMSVMVTSNSGTILNEVIGDPSFSGSGTVWTEYTRDFVALDS
jgi:predicted ribosomally synthesized peptide with SipW-like signal peptide